MEKTEETKNKTKETKPKTGKTTSAAKKSTVKGTVKKSTPAKKSVKAEKKPKQSVSSAAAAWKEKKAQLREKEKEPKTIAERKAYQEKGPIRRFLTKYNGFWDMVAVPFFTFSILCIYSIASKNERGAAVWCVNMSRHLFGAISPILYSLIAVYCVRLWLRNFERFKTMHHKRYLYLFGLYFLVALILEFNALKSIPPIPPEEAGGVIAETVVRMITNVLGSSGMLILLIFLTLFFIWQAWKFFIARDRERNNNDDEVPVRVYWDIHTADEAEAMEAERQKEELTTDIEADFRSAVGLMTAAEKENTPKFSIRKEAQNSLQKIRETIREIAQPIPDKDSMIPQEPPVEEVRPRQKIQSSVRIDVPKPSVKPTIKPIAEEKNTENVPAKSNTAVNTAEDKGKSQLKPQVKAKPRQLPLVPVQSEDKEKPAANLAKEEPETLPEPVFEENDNHNGSGLLSAPSKPVKPEKKEERVENVLVRSRTVTINEEQERVETTMHDYSFVPKIPEEKKTNESAPQSEDPWILPDIDSILDQDKQNKSTSPDDPWVKEQAAKIEELLQKHDVPCSVVDIQCGPTFTQFGVEPGFIVHSNGRRERVRINKIEMLRNDLLMGLSVKHLAIEAPIPGKTYVGIQIQNEKRTPVSLREVVESDEFRSRKRELAIALGKDINGAAYCTDLTRMPHLLIAGATGSGKSVCLNAILACLLLHYSPDQLKLVLIDPKRVELTPYNDIPHLITPVVTDVEMVVNILQWVLREMDMRNIHFMENGVRNIQEYNRKFPSKKLPYIVVVIDELANLMSEVGPEVENSIIRLAQTARAMGIHLIVATQRPSRDVITGTIKGNLPTRIAFAVASHIDSQVILDRPGAENLFGKGDMYFLFTEEIALKRLQCVYVSDEEIHRIASYWRKRPRVDNAPENNDPDLVNVPGPVTEKVLRPAELTNNGMLTQLPLFNEAAPQLKKDGDPLYDEAVKTVQRAGRASANMLVSKLGIGYSRANKLLARMEEEGIISPPNPNPAIPREILNYGPYGPSNDADN